MADGKVAGLCPESQANNSRRQSLIPADELARLCADGFSKRAMARHFNVAQGTIQKRLRKLGLSAIIVAPKKKEPGDRGFCERCSKPLMTKLQKRFCSRSCARAVQVRPKRALKSCPMCGKRTSNFKFCSVECRSKSRVKSDEHKREVARRSSRRNFRNYCARMQGATPADADMVIIRKIYANCPEGYEVDHIVPIVRGGLHHQDNLQYLPDAANRKKGNKLPEECPDLMALALPANADGTELASMSSGGHRFREILPVDLSGSRKGGSASRDRKSGVHKLSAEQHASNGRKGGLAMKGRPKSPEHVEKLRQASLAKWAARRAEAKSKSGDRPLITV